MKNLALTALSRIPSPAQRKIFQVRERMMAITEFYADLRRFLRHSGPSDRVYDSSGSRGHEAQAIKDYHRIEKGLSLREPRQPFGAEPSQRLRGILATPAVIAAIPGHVAAAAEEALDGLEQWNNHGEIDSNLAPFVAEPVDGPSVDFFLSRRSVRNFDPSRVVGQADITHAVEIAQSTPSVCNRQASRVHILTNPTKIRAALKLQSGNAGFGDDITTLAIITVDTRLFTGVGERNQGWIDGGLFAMTFVWGLHSIGVDSCMLNWSKSNSLSKKLRVLSDIPNSEDIICTVALGYAPTSSARAARSPRRPISEILTFDSQRNGA
ncbi:nitroreductase family protein [Zhihengliuella halotolerans]|uniref:Nitroreductase n=1 Tax=Zhihengliuella halotolerans TaxID=370736 RepID=A0A4Q8A9R5_9MICC|nr:nitroreductase family protein [Zhihengliuella halotolerans]RZU60822.1 nitroreductase [Zhihengliuella halotolerans]